jgi:hypothetical protein
MASTREIRDRAAKYLTAHAAAIANILAPLVKNCFGHLSRFSTKTLANPRKF